jgi:hypothetical protein
LESVDSITPGLREVMPPAPERLHSWERFVMWICLNDAFLSIVADQKDPAIRLVQAQVASHITNVFPDANVIETPRTDYRYQASVEADVVAKVLAGVIAKIRYASLTDNVRDNRLHHAYRDLSAVMHRLQPPTPIRKSSSEL